MKTPVIPLKLAQSFDGCVLAFGHFNTIHPGHIRYLKHAKDRGEKLVVALIGDGTSSDKPRFQFNQEERAQSLAVLDFVDAVILLEDSELNTAVIKLRPSYLVLGQEFKNKSDNNITEAIRLVGEYGNKVLFHAGDIHYSTSALLTVSQEEILNLRLLKFKEACKRQQLDLDRLLTSMRLWRGSRLIVLGDTILDQYAACEAIGMSAEAPVVVVRELESRNFIGGASVVASHIRSIGAQCDLISVVGKDQTAELIKNQLKQLSIGQCLVEDPSRPTTFKKRYVVENQKLFRVSRLEDHKLDKEIENQVIERLEELAPFSNGIVVSDFVYGVITERVLDVILSLAKKYNIMLFGDLQCSSQVGEVTKFKNFSLLCPNEREARVALKDKDSGLEQLCRNLIKLTNTERLIMKLGEEGFIAYDNESGKEINQPFPALSVNTLDVTGAGDSLLAVMSTGLSIGQPMMVTAAIGSCMSALAVERMGNSPISADDLEQRIRLVFKS